MPLKAVAEQAHEMTQPAVLAVGGAVWAGFSIDDIIKMGTILLMVLNIPLAVLRIREILTKKKKDE